jgi:hypothetical protein
MLYIEKEGQGLLTPSVLLFLKIIRKTLEKEKL